MQSKTVFAVDRLRALVPGVACLLLLALVSSARATAASAADEVPEKGEASVEKPKREKKSKEQRALEKKARSELVAAGKLGRSPRGTKTTERVQNLERAAAAFAKIEKDYAEHAGIVAEASFRRGQMLGRLGRADEAQAAFERSAGLASQRWGARALYEAGNVQRRSKRWTKALECYRKAKEASDPRYATKAWLSVGKALLRLGRVPEAREELRALAKDGDRDAFERVRAYDELANSFLAEKRFDPARAVLAEADAAFAEASKGDDKRSVRLRRSLQRMRSRKKLARHESEG